MAQCGDNSGQPSGLANQRASLDIRSFAPFIYFTRFPRLISTRTPMPANHYRFHIQNTHTNTHTHTHRSHLKFCPVSPYSSRFSPLLQLHNRFRARTLRSVSLLLPCIMHTTRVFHNCSSRLSRRVSRVARPITCSLGGWLGCACLHTKPLQNSFSLTLQAVCAPAVFKKKERER